MLIINIVIKAVSPLSLATVLKLYFMFIQSRLVLYAHTHQTEICFVNTDARRFFRSSLFTTVVFEEVLLGCLVVSVI